MRRSVLVKFKKFQLNPDLANKFLFTNFYQLPHPKNENIYLMYIFRQKNPYGFLALKSLMMLGSVLSKKSLTQTKLIRLKYTKTQAHSIIYVSLSFFELVNAMQLFFFKPAPIKKTMNSLLNETKHFIFPGNIRHLRMPSWKKAVNLSMQGYRKNQYWFYFYKTIFFD